MVETTEKDKRRIDDCFHAELVSETPEKFKCWNREVVGTIYRTGELTNGEEGNGNYLTDYFGPTDERVSLEINRDATCNIVTHPELCEKCPEYGTCGED